MNPLLVLCPYCGAQPGDPCRHTMLDGQPVTDTHRMRILQAQEHN